MESRSGAAKKRKGATTSRTVPIQFDQDKFVGPKQAARYISLEKRKILPEKRFLINPQGTNRNFAGLIDAKKWDRLINPLEHYDIEIVREFYANALPNDDEPFTRTTRVSGRTVAFFFPVSVHRLLLQVATFSEWVRLFECLRNEHIMCIIRIISIIHISFLHNRCS